LERDERVKIYLERDFEDLRIEHTSHRPEIIDYREVSKRRAPLYQALADIIVNIPTRLSKEQEFKLLLKNINKFFRAKPLKEGIILTTNEVPHSLQ
jgi:shikimate kinase